MTKSAPFTTATVLEARGVRFGYGDLTAVWDVDLTVERGKTTALLGRNGAGKTTLISGLMGLLPSKEGAVMLNGRDVTKMDPWRRVESGMGVVQEGKRVFRNLTVVENLEIGMSRLHGATRKDVLEETWEDFPVLAERRTQTGGQLSGGQAQMLSIATAMASRPDVLLVDEPSSGLAPIIVEQILTLIEKLKEKGLAILLVEQQVEEVLSGYADHVALLDQGRIVLSRPAGEVSLDDVSDVMFGGVTG